jgi:plasmid stabilization system protein ParE
MRYLVQLSPTAKRDLSEHRAWYRVRNRSVVKRFNTALVDILDTLAEAPLRWAQWRPTGLRRILLPRFPHTVVYRVDGAIVTVLGILHQQQDAARRFPEDP